MGKNAFCATVWRMESEGIFGIVPARETETQQEPV
jgi:hypothetical protein